jgi:hypothetical protein
VKSALQAECISGLKCRFCQPKPKACESGLALPLALKGPFKVRASFNASDRSTAVPTVPILPIAMARDRQKFSLEQCLRAAFLRFSRLTLPVGSDYTSSASSLGRGRLGTVDATKTTFQEIHSAIAGIGVRYPIGWRFKRNGI